jgi:hypothetical protein
LIAQGAQASRIWRKTGATRRKNELEGNECMALLSLKTHYFAATQQRNRYRGQRYSLHF